MKSQAILKDILDWGKFPEYDMLWTDPPWETRMLRWFETLQAKQTGTAPQNSLNELIEHLAEKTHRDKPAFVEYGVKGWKRVHDVMQSAGHQAGPVTEGIQTNGRPFFILTYNTDFRFPATGLKGGGYITHAVSQLGAKTVFDPFAGIGFTYKHVRAAGADYIGSEVNPARHIRLAKLMGQRP